MVLALSSVRKLKSEDGRVLKASPWQSQRAAGALSLAAHIMMVGLFVNQLSQFNGAGGSCKVDEPPAPLILPYRSAVPAAHFDFGSFANQICEFCWVLRAVVTTTIVVGVDIFGFEFSDC